MDKVLDYAANAGYCKPRKMAELAPGVVTALDLLYEYDTYFDSLEWEIVNPAKWEEDCLFPTVLKNLEVGVLPGVGKRPQVISFEDALDFAKRNLKSKKGVKMYDTPKIRYERGSECVEICDTPKIRYVRGN